jgi:hypothetical protein
MFQTPSIAWQGAGDECSLPFANKDVQEKVVVLLLILQIAESELH